MHARTWCRVDLAGGTLDIWPLGLLHPGARTVCVAVDVAAHVTVASRERGWRVTSPDGDVARDTLRELLDLPDAALAARVALALDLPPAEIRLESGSPRGAGLGASSAVACALVLAADGLVGWTRTPPEVVALVRDVEAQLMGLPTGIQDQYGSLLGGALEIRHRSGGEEVRRLEVDLEALGRSLLVVYTGSSHVSARSNWEVVRRRLDGDPQSAALFAGIAEIAAQVPPLLARGDLAAVGAAMGREWSLRRQLAPGLATPTIDALFAAALQRGAWGGKACGAGGGGCVALLAPPEARAGIATAARELGCEALRAAPVAEGAAVESLEAIAGR